VKSISRGSQVELFQDPAELVLSHIAYLCYVEVFKLRLEVQPLCRYDLLIPSQ